MIKYYKNYKINYNIYKVKIIKIFCKVINLNSLYQWNPILKKLKYMINIVMSFKKHHINKYGHNNNFLKNL